MHKLRKTRGETLPPEKFNENEAISTNSMLQDLYYYISMLNIGKFSLNIAIAIDAYIGMPAKLFIGAAQVFIHRTCLGLLCCGDEGQS
eukprot:scaffold681404_cov64-Prasinocladus_malaysianus.AAC.1